jgi:hypothetical protein
VITDTCPEGLSPVTVDLLSASWAAADGKFPGRAEPGLPGRAEGFEVIYAGNPDRQWVTVNFSTAWKITQRWASSTAPGHLALQGGPWFSVLRQRWRAWAEKLGIPPPAPAPPVVTFPEAVALTEILADLNWRRHIAMVRPVDLSRFYQRVAQHLGEPSYPDPPDRRDPLQEWVGQHRDRYAATRQEIWAQAFRRTQPFPEIRHFK